MTEDEAKTKWCPMTVFANYTTERNEIAERHPPETVAVIASRCIASACMMWREHIERIDRGFSLDVELKRLAPHGWEVDPEREGVLRKRIGYCGLAGKP